MEGHRAIMLTMRLIGVRDYSVLDDGQDISDCTTCFGVGWVCENHPKRAWSDELGCQCGASMPCECVSADGFGGARRKPGLRRAFNQIGRASCRERV